MIAAFHTEYQARCAAMSIDALRAEYDRQSGWRSRWLELAGNREHMRRMGGLQSQQDYVLRRADKANRKIAVVLDFVQKHWSDIEAAKAAAQRHEDMMLRIRAMEVGTAYYRWLAACGESPSFSGFVNAFGYQEQDGKSMFERLMRVFDALEVVS